MKLALRELRRRPGRFVTATVILTLIAVLLMFLGGLLDGLIRNSTGAITAQDADAIVYSATAQGSLLRSRIDAETRARVEAVPGVTEVGGLGVALFGARVPGESPRDLAPVAVLGYELAPIGVPPPPADGQAYADEVLRSNGVDLGDTLLVGPARSEITVIGWVANTAYNGSGGLWTNLDTWRTVVADNRPAAALADGVHVEGGSSHRAAPVQGRWMVGWARDISCHPRVPRRVRHAARAEVRRPIRRWPRPASARRS